MDIKVGANGDIALAVNAAGDVVVSFVDKEALSDQSAVIALHPSAVSAALVKALGGSPTIQAIVGYAVPALVALLPKV